MRILQLHTRYREPGGEDQVVRAEASLLRAAGHTVVEHVEQNPEATVAAATGLARAPWNAAAAARVRRRVADASPDVAHLHNWWFAMSPAVLPALSASQVPVVATLHNYRLLCVNALLFRDGGPCTDCVGRLPLPGVRHRCYRGSAAASAAVATTLAVHRRRGTWDRDVDLFLTVSAFARDRFVEGGVDPDRIVVKPNPVLDPGDRPASPSASGSVLVVSRLAPEKGIDRVVQAWGRAAPADLELVIVGDGPERARLEALAGPSVRFAGYLPAAEVRALMLTSRALLFNTLCLETFGLVAVEAMAAGLPVAVPAIGGAAEAVDGRCGWVLEANDVDAWCDVVAGLDDDGAVDRQGAAGRARYAATYAPDVALDALLAAYRRVGAS